MTAILNELSQTLTLADLSRMLRMTTKTVRELHKVGSQEKGTSYFFEQKSTMSPFPALGGPLRGHSLIVGGDVAEAANDTVLRREYSDGQIYRPTEVAEV